MFSSRWALLKSMVFSKFPKKGFQNPQAAEVIPAGSTQDTATVLTSPVTIMVGPTDGSAAGSGTGVRLPNRPIGEIWWVRNRSQSLNNSYVNVYAPSGGLISIPNGSVTSIRLPPGEAVGFISGGTPSIGNGSSVWYPMSGVTYNTTGATRYIQCGGGTLKLIAGTTLDFDVGSGTNNVTSASWNMAATQTLLGPTLQQRFVLAKTSDYSIHGVVANNDTGSGTLFTNEGAGSQVIFSLPTAVTGLTYGFYVQTAQNIRIQPSSGDNVRTAAGVSTTTTGHADCATAGSIIWISAVNATEWIAEYQTGTWTVT